MCTRRGIWCYSDSSIRVQGEARWSCCVPSECYRADTWVRYTIQLIVSQYAWRSASRCAGDSGYTIVYCFNSGWCSGVCSRATYRYYDARCTTYRRTCYCTYRVAYRMDACRSVWCYSNRSIRVQSEARRGCCIPSKCYRANTWVWNAIQLIISQYTWCSASCGTSDSSYTIVYCFNSCWCSGACSRTTYRYYDARCTTYRRTCYCTDCIAYCMCTRRGIWRYRNRSVRVQGEAYRSCCIPSECY